MMEDHHHLHHVGKQHSAPAFLEKLYEILEDPKLDEYIGKNFWNHPFIEATSEKKSRSRLATGWQEFSHQESQRVL
jgi:hypothetical protein